MQFRKGLQAAIPIVIGYIPIAVSFGIISTEKQLSVTASVFMSATVYAGASQFMAVSMLSVGTPIFEIVITTLFMNLRHIIMNLSLLPQLHGMSGTKKALFSLGITDETFAVASLTKDNDIRTVPGMAGLIMFSFLAWVGGTMLGSWIALFIPEVISRGMSVALYAMFIAVLVPALRQNGKYLLVVTAAIAINAVLQNFISSGWSLVIAIVLGSFLSPFLERKGKTSNEN
ncbi:inner membrane protein YgaZ [Scytonema sp. HK-05]|uniref:AzlC family ABC transporter permease n=1 Tax=Scytonema sp. HK-05 TaxID=1137095 RepID=UPI000A4614E5|nr:AzlC family ABC transporter permease [Scytonema sp. HK-05]BAY44934.1 inner membrane protein YgaZ [Scytonema sp. HK-05]